MTPHKPLALPVRTLIAATLALSAGGALAQSATEAALAARLDQLATELAAVKAQLAVLQQRGALTPATLPAAAPVALPGAAAAVGTDNIGTTAAAAVTPLSSAADAVPSAPAGPATVITSYGEINYNRPVHAPQTAQADVRRWVLGFQHRFDERTKLITELEVEHAVASASDKGEVAVEQAYIERQLTPLLALRAGLFLMPAGLLNENHEPTAFYGVERNFVETAIIPSTWREGGLQLVASFDDGLTAQGGLSTSFDLTQWDATSTEGRESPLGAIHQELSQARSRDLAVFGALNWRGVPGLLLGGSVFSGQGTQGQATTTARITLWDAHARWTPGRWDLSTVYARGDISNTAALNAPRVGSTTLIPKRFDGFYLQGAYKLWSHGDHALSPFVRWERFNTASAYADLGAGLTPAAARAERVTTLGANFVVSPGVVLKADWQRFREAPDLDRVNLGLGWSF